MLLSILEAKNNMKEYTKFKMAFLQKKPSSIKILDASNAQNLTYRKKIKKDFKSIKLKQI